MNWLLLGYSEIAKKRVIPALVKCGVKNIDIASKNHLDDVCLPNGIVSNFLYKDYEDAIRNSKAEIVYISTINSLHAHLAEISLLENKHVIVDKPAFLSLSETRFLIKIAQNRGLCLAEATVFAYHSMIQGIRDSFLKNNSFPTHLITSFTFPPLSPNNFRYSKTMGGGALLDLGPYTVSIWRLFFGELPEKLYCTILDYLQDVETSYSCMASFKGGRSMVGHFGFTTGYSNQIELLGPDIKVTVDRFFTLTADMECAIHICYKNYNEVKLLSACDQFAEFIKTVIISINNNNISNFTENMLQDALGFSMLKEQCRE
jgi:dTDP-3,4-didehydro-2,6-dideoxy-alpha-D-glucose 3-reductase